MKHVQNFFKRLADWIFQGARFPAVLSVAIVLAVTATVLTVSLYNKPESKTVTAYVTVKGLENGNNFENRQISVTDGDSLAEIFSLKYKDIYEAFGQPLIQYNEFQSLLGVRKTNEKSFHVTIDGVFDSNLSQAYVYGGQTIVISYY